LRLGRHTDVLQVAQPLRHLDKEKEYNVTMMETKTQGPRKMRANIMRLPEEIRETMDGMVDKIEEMLPEAKVYLFGSWATGKQTPDSDIDICVVVPESDTEPMETCHLIRKSVRHLVGRPMDILTYEKKKFEERARLIPTIQYTIVTDGVLLND